MSQKAQEFARQGTHRTRLQESAEAVSAIRSKRMTPAEFTGLRTPLDSARLGYTNPVSRPANPLVNNAVSRP